MQTGTDRLARAEPWAGFCCTPLWRLRSEATRCWVWSMPGFGTGTRLSTNRDAREPLRTRNRGGGSTRWRVLARLLETANSITIVSDRESDIYEFFAARPPNVHQIVRAGQDRNIKSDTEGGTEPLFPHIDGLPESGRFRVNIPAAPGRKTRSTELALRFSPVKLCKPLHAKSGDLPDSIALTLVDVREVGAPEDGKPIHWRLLTTHTVINLAAARRIVDLYRMRWTIEEFFRTLKTAGFDIEEADIHDPQVMMKLVAAVTVSAVTVMQLVKSRDGTTDQQLADAFEPDDQSVLEALSARLEGGTTLQKNPHPKGSLAFGAWVVARLGGWTGYYGKPGPKVMRRGLEDFRRIKYGTTLRLQDV